MTLRNVITRWNNLKTGMWFLFSAHIYDNIRQLMNTVANCRGCIGNSGFPEPERTNSNARSRHSYRPLVLPRHVGGEGVMSIIVTICTVSFNIPKFYIPPTMCLYVKYVSKNQQQIFFPFIIQWLVFVNENASVQGAAGTVSLIKRITFRP